MWDLRGQPLCQTKIAEHAPDANQGARSIFGQILRHSTDVPTAEESQSLNHEIMSEPPQTSPPTDRCQSGIDKRLAPRPNSVAERHKNMCTSQEPASRPRVDWKGMMSHAFDRRQMRDEQISIDW
ncbi:hypothetical protein B0H10DRAFT_2385331 [Mycena sp. CBHHK59/15]|nr:hypothetical protein B0H10DRAFT_2385331 [Mycena sp. CBHHK59/15]